ncbi:PAAR domain-containing protein [Pseudomonas sp. NPDC087358]|uniref:PAAR domain-containing protein n=1 Tax=Pseudomonas sp. NPDC087358 TaxID=3364439 RepID=UPI00384F22BB
MDALAAARFGDDIAHGFAIAAMLGGAVAGALVGAAVIAATVTTGGVAAAILAGCIAAGGLSTLQIVKGISSVFSLSEPKTGALIRGSANVYINGRSAMRAGEDASSSCTGFPLNHPLWPFPVLIAEGSATVYINGMPAARMRSKMACGAHIKSGSENTFIGGPTISVVFILDIANWMHTGFDAVGLMAAGGALVLAAMAGAATLAGVVVVGATALGGMALLGDLGDRLGPGYRDLLQGVAGMTLLGVGSRVARPSNPNRSLLEELTSNGVKFTAKNIVAVARDHNGKIVFLETGSAKAGLRHIIDRHGHEFSKIGVLEAEIPGVLIRAVTEGNIVGYQGAGTGRPIYEVILKGQTHRIAVSVGSNGYIVGANLKGTIK